MGEEGSQEGVEWVEWVEWVGCLDWEGWVDSDPADNRSTARGFIFVAVLCPS